ncbi:hypothetical protein Mkiyose1665_13540 [Mycobacterium kiyosense]|uniref:Uncharacterized protein n=1 Tax=Mycobacterium kiyosense TaxID=2871094 RepID=A0A9P3UZU0_9MYCO|nr:hypothetical protein IWGMT90018_02450 [Mycobacterium kiyosense]BDE11652.1 hypothetical protein MKCMC460_05120 [Mycobacterium sp. 20KCMC460]GLB81930.1 hypothetical protein SRL2020028_11860 [Mycobacterium kiyosense]GLB88110.1 hypothetical protein SRL2020130_09270 [Mycobacterium kiyosense]GLB95670.1 hypothetical protein SRL2020226_24460 [Mycobacterium kiyosense]
MLLKRGDRLRHGLAAHPEPVRQIGGMHSAGGQRHERDGLSRSDSVQSSGRKCRPQPWAARRGKPLHQGGHCRLPWSIHKTSHG